MIVWCGLSVNMTVVAQTSDDQEGVTLSNLRKQFVKSYLQAERGRPEAQYAVGMMYYSGHRVPQDSTLAVAWLTKAANQNDPNAQYFLSLLYGLGDGVERDNKTAAQWCQKAAEQGHPDAQYALGRMYSVGQGLERDDAMAAGWLTLAAEQGHADAQCELGSMYRAGKGVKRNYHQALQWWFKAAEQGHPWAALLLQEPLPSRASPSNDRQSSSNEEAENLIDTLAQDMGVVESSDSIAPAPPSPVVSSGSVKRPQDSPAANMEKIPKQINSGPQGESLQEPAAGDRAPASVVLGGQTPSETGLEPGPAGVVDTPQSQAVLPVEISDPAAQYELALRYYEGDKTQQNYTEALKWFKMAADQGYPQAQYKLGVMYSFGQGVTQNSSEAANWFRKAAEQELPAAQYSLGVMYATGQGVRLDPAAAAEWYTRAADQGSAAAQYMLGVIYGNGQGVTRNSETSVYWYTQAAEQGVTAAQYLLGVLYEKGQGVVIPDNTVSLKWYTLAAERGHAQAQCDLAMKYMTGQSIEKDFVKAYAWFLLAARNDKNVAAQERWLEERMTVQEQEQARQMARDILKHDNQELLSQ
ncbi:MAG: tetratricopeptide repeat protein [Planctomycetota bacterium]